MILIAEDEELNFQYLQALLKDFSAAIARARNGSEAITMCKNNPEIDLVLMDVGMPLVDGLQATKEIKTLRPDLPVIIQTAYTMREEQERANEAGCDACITKPIKPLAFRKVLAKFI